MGSCLSKKCTRCSSANAIPEPPDQSKSNTDVEKKKKAEEGTVKKEIFIIKHQKSHSHDFDRRSEEEKVGANQKVTYTTTTASITSEEIEIGNNGIRTINVINGGLGNGSVIVRTSSCTKEEVDAILIQCGRLSRSSSAGKAALSGSGGGSCENTGNPQRGRKYSGSKRSYDFDCDSVKGNEIEECNYNDNGVDGDGMAAAERIYRHRQRQRHSRAGSSPSGMGRRRTPSRERDQQQQEQQRSGSRERGGSGGGRRVSRSPGRRSESPISTTNSVTGSSTRPGKMVSVPATVSSLAMDKSNNGGGAEPLSGTTIRRISVKRNAGAASPRSRSPARANVSVSNDNQNAHFNQHLQQPLSRSNSRKAENSPHRRNPLSEIDANILPTHKSANNNNIVLQTPMQKPSIENASDNKVVQRTENKTSNGKGALDEVVTLDCRAKQQQQQVTRDTTVLAVGSRDESLKPQTLTRSRSSRRSRELDLNPEALLNPNSSYTALLLEDIQNFHQKTTTTTTTFSLPPCVTKACSILEAVADLNSSTSSNLSCTISDDRRSLMSQQFNKHSHSHSFSSGANPAGKKRLDTKTPFAESEMIVADDLMEPSLHKYVTVRRGTVGEGDDIEEQESSGSNSFVGSQQHWVSSSSWEPNSADSTDCWTTSKSNASEDVRSQLGLPRHALSDMNEAQRRLSGNKKRECDQQQIVIGRGRDGSSRGGLHTMPTTAAAAAAAAAAST